MRLSGAPQWIGGCHPGRRDDPARMPWALTHGPNARSSVSLVDALLPDDILATSGLIRNYPNRDSRSVRSSRKATNFCLTFALLVLI